MLFVVCCASHVRLQVRNLWLHRKSRCWTPAPYIQRVHVIHYYLFRKRLGPHFDCWDLLRSIPFTPTPFSPPPPACIGDCHLISSVGLPTQVLGYLAIVHVMYITWLCPSSFSMFFRSFWLLRYWRLVRHHWRNMMFLRDGGCIALIFKTQKDQGVVSSCFVIRHLVEKADPQGGSLLIVIRNDTLFRLHSSDVQ